MASPYACMCVCFCLWLMLVRCVFVSIHACVCLWLVTVCVFMSVVSDWAVCMCL